MKNILMAICLLIPLVNIAQTDFETGYFINNAGVRKECLIKNLDWKNNPESFTYKTNVTGEPVKASISEVREFGITGESKYLRFKGEMDRSTDDLNSMGSERQVKFEEVQLFLQELVAGDAHLYYYEQNNLRRFFYNTSETPITQLVYKRYKKSPGIVGQNVGYRQQLWNDLKCHSISRKATDKLNYHKEDLVSIFRQYNSCIHPEVAIINEAKEKFDFNLTLRPGVNFNSLEINNNSFGNLNVDFGQVPGYRVGGLVEAVLPFNNNKWSFFFEPALQNYKSEGQTRTNGFTESQNVNVKYTSLEVPMGIMHYMYLNTKSKLFLSGAFIYDKELNSLIRFDNGSELEIDSLTSWSAGGGYVYNNMLSMEFRYSTQREILNSYQFWDSGYGGYSLILGYVIF